MGMKTAEQVAVMLREAVSYGQIRSAIRAALNPPDAQGRETWRYSLYDEIYPGYAIVEDNKPAPGGVQYYRVDYTVDDKDRIHVGAKTPGKMVWVSIVESNGTSAGGRWAFEGLSNPRVPSAGDGDALTGMDTLLEAQAADATGKVWDVTLIKPGWSRNGPPRDFYYGKEVLAEAVSLYEGAKAYADHPTETEQKERPERSVRDLVGWYEGIQPAADGSLKGQLHLYDSAVPWLAPILRERPQALGLSHNALGKARMGEAEGRKGRVVDSIGAVESVDIVTKAAAGGSVDRLVASIREGDTDVDLKDLTLDQLKESRPDLVQGIEAAAKAALKSEADSALGQLREAVTRTDTDNKALRAENAQIREAQARAEARAVIAEKLGASNLPEPARARVRQILEAAAVPLKEGALDKDTFATRITEAITAEQTYLTAVTGSPVRGAGAGGADDANRLQEAAKKAQAALDKAFDVTPDKSEKEAAK